MDNLAKKQNIFAYSFVSEHSTHFFFYIEKKKNIFSVGGGGLDVLPTILSEVSDAIQFLRVQDLLVCICIEAR